MSGGGGSGGDDIPNTGTDGHVLTKDSGTALGYAWAAAPGAGGGAATTSAFVTIGNDAALSAERALTDDGATVQHTDGGAGTTVTTSVRDNGISNAKLRDSSALSVIGRSAATSGDPADIAGTDGQVLRVSGTALGFGTIATAGIADAAVTLAKQANLAQDTLIGRQTASTGMPEAIACTAAGRALIDDADAAAQRTTLGLGTLATQSGTFSGTSSGTNTGDQTNISGNAATVTTNANLTGPVTSVGNATTIADAELAAIAGLTSAADTVPYFTGSGTAALASLTSAGRALLDDADATAQRATLGLVIGTNVQAYDAELAAIAGLTSAADRLPYFTGSGTASLATFTAAGRAILDDADAAAQRTTLGAAPLASPVFTGNVSVAIPSTVTTAGTTATIDWANGVGQNFDAQGSSGNITFTFSNPASGASYVLLLQQGSTARTYTWPASVKWLGGVAPTVSTTDNDIDMVTFFYNGTNYIGSHGGKYTP